MKNNIKKAIKAIHDYSKAMKPYKAIVRKEMKDVIMRVEGVKVCYAPTTLRLQGVLMAATTWGAMCGHIILVDDVFNQLDTDMQQTLLMHEMGHIRCGHIKQHIKEMYTTLLNMADGQGVCAAGRHLQEEIEADRYASDIVGVDNVRDMLQYIVNSCICDHTEIYHRANALSIELKQSSLAKMIANARTVSVNDI